MQLTDWFCRHKVCILYAERLVTGTTLFVNLHYQQLVIRQCQLGQHEDVAYCGLAVHRCQTVVSPYRLYNILRMAVRLATFLSTTLKRIWSMSNDMSEVLRREVCRYSRSLLI